MFESAELEHKIDKATYRREAPKLREALLNSQYDLKENGRFPVLILIAGVEGAGKGETVNLLNEWMDPRHIYTHAFPESSDEERERPPLWRFWRALPPKGRIGILFGSWYTAPIIDRVFKRTSAKDLLLSIEEINHFERMLADEGALILKFWFHLSKKRQKKRLKQLESDPETSWRISDRDWDFFKLYDRFYRISEDTLRETSTRDAPWIVVLFRQATADEMPPDDGGGVLARHGEIAAVARTLDFNQPFRSAADSADGLPERGTGAPSFPLAAAWAEHFSASHKTTLRRIRRVDVCAVAPATGGSPKGSNLAPRGTLSCDDRRNPV